jgi:hypothetical protein
LKPQNFLRHNLIKLQEISPEKQALETSRKATASHFEEGDLVNILHPTGSDLQTPNRKIILKWVGPYMIYSILADSSCMIQNLDGLIISTVISTKHLKKASIRTDKGKLLRTRAEVIKALKTNNNPESELLRNKLTEEP